MWKTQNWPKNSFFRVEEGRESRRQTFSPSEMARRENAEGKPNAGGLVQCDYWGLFELCV